MVDELYTPKVGSWAREKYDLIHHYADIFSTSMHNKWYTVCLDLFCGAGKSRIRDTDTILDGSPYQTMRVRKPFKQYIFNDSDRNLINSLEIRIAQDFNHLNTITCNFDTNIEIEEILSLVKSESPLIFCILDPFTSNNLHFSTIRSICESFRTDFLILIPTDMDIGRNPHNYSNESSHVMDNFLGDDNWRKKWEIDQKEGTTFKQFIFYEFCNRMKNLSYIYSQHRPINRSGTQRTIYNLVFFSREEKALDFFNKSVKGSNPQQKLDL